MVGWDAVDPRGEERSQGMRAPPRIRASAHHDAPPLVATASLFS
jgi:hypothetical protein